MGKEEKMLVKKKKKANPNISSSLKIILVALEVRLNDQRLITFCVPLHTLKSQLSTTARKQQTALLNTVLTSSK